MRTAAIHKYLALARLSFTQACEERGELYGRVAFFVVILGVFASLWRAVAEAGMPLAARPRNLVWYLASTEWILLSVPMIFFEMQEAIRGGDVVYRLGRPLSYLLAEYAEGLGVLALRVAVLGPTAWACAFLFTGWIPPLEALVKIVAFGVAAAAVLLGLYLCIGLLAFWLQDVTPVFWVWQKLMFVLGGLMLPLAVYPRLVQQAARYTPFPALLAGPASFALGMESVSPAALAGTLALWSCVTSVTAYLMFRTAVSEISVNGG